MTNIEIYKNVPAIPASSRFSWRKWLADHHITEKSVWLIIYKKESGIPSVYYPEAVDEALCFGWVDSSIAKRDEKSYYQYFAKRSPKSNWSRVNKDKIEYLTHQGLMQPAGIAMVELAKETGTWTALEDVDNLIVPEEMVVLFETQSEALKNWENFSNSSKRGILEWIYNAKKPETKMKRIYETLTLAAQNIRAQFKN
jgi:uncharacterized protein YdeI (YjbR/CyaY-like superfamily)